MATSATNQAKLARCRDILEDARKPTPETKASTLTNKYELRLKSSIPGHLPKPIGHFSTLRRAKDRLGQFVANAPRRSPPLLNAVETADGMRADFFAHDMSVLLTRCVVEVYAVDIVEEELEKMEKEKREGKR